MKRKVLGTWDRKISKAGFCKEQPICNVKAAGEEYFTVYVDCLSVYRLYQLSRVIYRMIVATNLDFWNIKF